MSRVLLTVSGAMPDDLAAHVAADRRPRTDYSVLRQTLGFDLIDEPTVFEREPWARHARRLVGRHVPFSLAVLAASAGYDTVVTDAEHTGLPLAAGFRLRSLLHRRRPRHVMICHRLSAPKKARLHRLLRLDRAIDTYVVYATEQQRRLIADLGIPAHKITRTGFMADERFWRPEPVASAAARPTICSVGLERRDHSTLVTAAAGLDADVVIAAGSPWAATRWTPSGTLPENVVVTELSADGLRDLYRDCRLVVVPLVPTDFQAGVTTILEAMAMARPVVYTAIPGQTDVVVDGVTGLSVPPGDAGAMREAIESLLADPDRADRMGRAGRARYEAEFTLDAYAVRLGTIVESAR